MRHVILPTIWFPVLLGLFCAGWGYLADRAAYARGFKDGRESVNREIRSNAAALAKDSPYFGNKLRETLRIIKG